MFWSTGPPFGSPGGSPAGVQEDSGASAQLVKKASRSQKAYENHGKSYLFNVRT